MNSSNWTLVWKDFYVKINSNFFIGRADREPSKFSKVCSYHFRDGKKSAGPEIFKRNADKLFPSERNDSQKKKKKVKSSEVNDVMTIIAAAVQSSEETLNVSTYTSTEQIILEAELDLTKQELNSHQEAKQYLRTHYSAQKSSGWKLVCQPKRSLIL